MDTTPIMSPLIQYGFAGFSLILLAVLVWLIRELLIVLKANNRVMQLNLWTKVPKRHSGLWSKSKMNC